MRSSVIFIKDVLEHHVRRWQFGHVRVRGSSCNCARRVKRLDY